ncbi:hypothetical protein GBA52_003478 [Prunus armeniaca]|nr:hypothetical protein GBA52_003478 [Prunus armeniaca]
MNFQGTHKSILSRRTFHLHRHGQGSQIHLLRHRNMDIRVTSMKGTNPHHQLPHLPSTHTTTTTKMTMPAILSLEAGNS